MRNRRNKIIRNEISNRFLKEIKKSLLNFQDLNITYGNVTFDNLNRDKLPLIQVSRVKSQPYQRPGEPQKWAFLYSVQIVFAKKEDEDPYTDIDLVLDDMANHFNKVSLDAIDLDGLVESVVIVDMEDDEGIFNDIAVAEVFFEIVAV